MQSAELSLLHLFFTYFPSLSQPLPLHATSILLFFLHLTNVSLISTLCHTPADPKSGQWQ